MLNMVNGSTKGGLGMVLTLLPGPDRKRSPNLYSYRITYRNPRPEEMGCVMTWSVEGGRESYQIALERDEFGDLRWHCTCPDAIYRSEVIQGHMCKHVKGLMECTPPTWEHRKSA